MLMNGKALRILYAIYPFTPFHRITMKRPGIINKFSHSFNQLSISYVYKGAYVTSESACIVVLICTLSTECE